MEAKEMVTAVNRLLDCISAAQEIVQKATPSEVYGCVETFVVNKVEIWTPEGHQQAGWVLSPLGEMYSNWCGNFPNSVEFVAFNDVGKIDDQRYIGVIPKVGDVVIVCRNPRTLLRESIQLLRIKEG